MKGNKGKGLVTMIKEKKHAIKNIMSVMLAAAVTFFSVYLYVLPVQAAAVPYATLATQLLSKVAQDSGRATTGSLFVADKPVEISQGSSIDIGKISKKFTKKNLKKNKGSVTLEPFINTSDGPVTVAGRKITAEAPLKTAVKVTYKWRKKKTKTKRVRRNGKTVKKKVNSWSKPITDIQIVKIVSCPEDKPDYIYSGDDPDDTYDQEHYIAVLRFLGIYDGTVPDSQKNTGTGDDKSGTDQDNGRKRLEDDDTSTDTSSDEDTSDTDANTSDQENGSDTGDDKKSDKTSAKDMLASDGTYKGEVDLEASGKEAYPTYEIWEAAMKKYLNIVTPSEQQMFDYIVSGYTGKDWEEVSASSFRLNYENYWEGLVMAELDDLTPDQRNTFYQSGGFDRIGDYEAWRDFTPAEVATRIREIIADAPYSTGSYGNTNWENDSPGNKSNLSNTDSSARNNSETGSTASDYGTENGTEQSNNQTVTAVYDKETELSKAKAEGHSDRYLHVFEEAMKNGLSLEAAKSAASKFE